MSHVIAIANQKGGVGKTTTAINLGASLAAAEQRVLIIDMDPQGNATSGLGVNARSAKSTLYGVLLNRLPLGSAIIRGVHFPLLDVIPTTVSLVGAEAELVGQPRWQFRLREALDGTREMYDFILIDCPPALGVLTLNTLVAADTVLIPLQPEYFALEGLSQFSETLEVVREHLNPRLGVEGVLLTMYDGRLKLAPTSRGGSSEPWSRAMSVWPRLLASVSLRCSTTSARPALRRTWPSLVKSSFGHP
jgi:chromosome partitioning protein